jgi:hypothetical protein
MPPPGGIAGISGFSSGRSLIITEVVSMRDATDDAF